MPTCTAPRRTSKTRYAHGCNANKEFTITERVRLRFNVDAFNAFNIQGLVNPNASDGIQSLQQSYWTPRQIQFTGRLSF